MVLGITPNTKFVYSLKPGLLSSGFCVFQISSVNTLMKKITITTIITGFTIL